MDNLEVFPIIKAKALIVEDDPAWLNYFHHTVASQDTFFEYTHAPDLKTAIELLSKNTFQLILLDLMLPDSSGVNTVKSIIEYVKFVPIVVLTSMNDTILQEDSMETGIEDYLVKGEYDSKVFFHVVHQAIRRCLARDGTMQSILEQLQKLNEEIERLKLTGE